MNHQEQTATKILDRYVQYLTKEHFRISELVKNEYSYQVTISDDKEKIILHVYFGKKGNKIVLQGNKDLKLFKKINDLIFGEKLIPEVKPELEPEYPYIGTDESGKGDYFGPLVVAGVYITPESGKYLAGLGIRDSKELSDFQVKQYADEIRKVTEIKFDVVRISPEKYNKLYEKMGNLNKMMAWAHSRVIENLLSNCDVGDVISDKFGNEKLIIDALQERGRSINLKQVTKAEKFTAVAAASILARKSVIEWFNVQSKKFKCEVPKGASGDVEKIAKQFLEKYGEEVIRKMVKLHFKTSNKVFNS